MRYSDDGKEDSSHRRQKIGVGVQFHSSGTLMKRDWDTIRDVLTKLEELPGPADVLDLSKFPTDRAAEISYHVELLIDAGLVEGEMSRNLDSGPADFYAERLTWDGHEFLDSVRSDTVWNKTKKSFIANGISMTFDTIKSVASEVTASIIKSSIGS